MRTNKHANKHVTCCKLETGSASANAARTSAHDGRSLATARGERGHYQPANDSQEKRIELSEAFHERAGTGTFSFRKFEFQLTFNFFLIR
ncbi:unnamed protein product [Colias eurytheme]|nr:unnamed protein product [Colias eurytheme]